MLDGAKLPGGEHVAGGARDVGEVPGIADDDLPPLGRREVEQGATVLSRQYHGLFEHDM